MYTDKFKTSLSGVISFSARLLLFVLLLSPGETHATTVLDQNGNTLTFDKPFTRIISLYPAHTQNLIDLGLQTKLVGVSISDDNTVETQNIQRFSYRDDPEKFIAARPDLVLIRPMIERSYPGFIKHLKRTGITVISLQPRNIDEMFEYWKTLGKLTDSEEQASEMISAFKSSLEDMNQTLQGIPISTRPRVYFQAIHKKMRTFSPSSMTIFCLEQAGGINIAKDATPRFQTNIAEYGKERIISHSNEIDIFLAQVGRMNPITIEEIQRESGFKAIKAVREGRVFLIDEKKVSRPTMGLLDGINTIHTILYSK